MALSSQQVKSVCAQIVSISMQEGKGLELQLEWFRLDIRKNFLIDRNKPAKDAERSYCLKCVAELEGSQRFSSSLCLETIQF